MGNAMNTLKILLIIMLLYSMGITMYTHALPENTITQLRPFQGPSDSFPNDEIVELTDTQYLDQLDIPLINVGALVFYTGNILLDLVVNFVTAIPQMLALLLNSLSLLGVNIDTVLLNAVQLAMTLIFSVLFVIAIVELAVDIRSGRQIGGVA